MNIGQNVIDFLSLGVVVAKQADFSLEVIGRSSVRSIFAVWLSWLGFKITPLVSLFVRHGFFPCCYHEHNQYGVEISKARIVIYI